MAVNTSTTTTGINLSSNDDDDQTLINSDILVNKSLLTDKQRRILLATEAMIGREDVSFTAIARNAAVSTNYVRLTLRKYIDRENLPADCRFGKLCSPLKDYDDLTDTQRSIINEKIANPESTNAEIHSVVDCSESHVHQTLLMYEDIVESKRAEICQ